MCFTVICVYFIALQGFTLEKQDTYGQIPIQPSRVPTEDQNSYSVREKRMCLRVCVLHLRV